MSHLVTRRRALIGAAATMPFIAAPALAVPPSGTKTPGEAKLRALEKKHGGRLGVFVRDTGNGAQLAHRADARLPMCSTFKFLLAAAVLKRVDDGQMRLDQEIAYGTKDLLDYAPVAKQHVESGRLSVGALCGAAVVWSDNTAANLLLTQLGGPKAVTDYARSLGDKVTRLDRMEPELNRVAPGDPRDTTSAQAMAGDLQAILTGNALSAVSRQRLEDWMVASPTGRNRLRAGLPAGWRVGDKTGTGQGGSTNTVAIVRPPQKAPLVVAIYYTGSKAPLEAREAVHAEIARLIAETF